MKRSAVISILIIGIALLGLPLAIEKVNNGKENVVIIQEVLSGSPEAARGVTLRMASHWDGNLLWNTEYTIGGGDTESLFTFSGAAVRWGSQECRSAKADFLYGSGFGTAVGNYDKVVGADWLPYPEIIRAVADRTQPGEKRGETVEIGEYYEYYPVSFELSGSSVKYLGDYDENLKYLTGLFQISTAQDCLRVETEKLPEGNLAAVSGRNDTDGEDIMIAQASAFGTEGCYYAFCCEDMKTGKRADRGENGGIFYLPFTETKGWMQVDLTQMRLMCPLPENILPVGMLLDEEKEYLYLVAEGEEDWRLYTYTLNGEAPVLAQELMIRQGKESLQNAFYQEDILEEREYLDLETDDYLYFRRIQRVEGGLLITWNDNGFSFVTLEGGRYRLWCGGCFPYNHSTKPFSWENTCAFDGERLVLAAFENWQSMNVLLTVYEEGEEAYCGLYHYSGGEDLYPDRFNRGGILPQGRNYSWYPYVQYGRDSVLPGTDVVIRPLEVVIR